MAIPTLCNVFDASVPMRIYAHARKCKAEGLYTGKDATLYAIMFNFEASATMRIVEEAIPKGIAYTEDDVRAYCLHLMLGCSVTNAISLWAKEYTNGVY